MCSNPPLHQKKGPYLRSWREVRLAGLIAELTIDVLRRVSCTESFSGTPRRDGFAYAPATLAVVGHFPATVVSVRFGLLCASTGLHLVLDDRTGSALATGILWSRHGRRGVGGRHRFLVISHTNEESFDPSVGSRLERHRQALINSCLRGCFPGYWWSFSHAVKDRA